MNVGKYKIGRYHAIIKKEYEDGSFDYETNFISHDDLMESVIAMECCKGKLVGIATDNPKVLKDFSVIRGKNEISKELLNEEK